MPAKPKRKSKKGKNKGSVTKNADTFADSLFDLIPLSQELEVLKMKEFIEENNDESDKDLSLAAHRKPTKQQQIAQILVQTDEAFKRIDDINASTNSS